MRGSVGGITMSEDISNILDGWDYRPDRPAVREIVGEDGQPKIQLRIDLGLLQMETSGRPDGMRPHGQDTLLDHYRNLLLEHRGHDGGEFSLTEEDCVKLQLESMQFYHRRISWLELGDYRAAERDADHNLQIISMVGEHAQTDQLRETFVQWKPFILVHRTMARARHAWEQREFDRAIGHIDDGIEAISEAYRSHGRTDSIEESGEIAYLRKWAEEIDQARPLSLEQRLERELDEAIRSEAFERAAVLRDRLKGLNETSEPM